MKATFLVTVEMDGQDDPTVIASDIQESLLDDGFSITDVHPWSRHNLTPVTEADDIQWG